MEGLEKHLTERTMTAEEYIKESIKKSWSGRGEIIYVSDALEAIRLSKIEQVEETMKKVIAYNDRNENKFSNEGFRIMNDMLSTLTSQINQLKNGK